MHDFKERLLSYISDTKVGSMREFERKCGLTNGQISSIGAQGPTASVLKKIADTCPDLDMNWLFRGEGATRPPERPAGEVINIGNWDELITKLKEISK